MGAGDRQTQTTRADGTFESSLSDAPFEYFALLARRATAVTLNEGDAVVANLTLVTLDRP